MKGCVCEIIIGRCSVLVGLLWDEGVCLWDYYGMNVCSLDYYGMKGCACWIIMG